MAKRKIQQENPSPPFYAGMPVSVTDSGATGRVVMVVADQPDAEGGLRIEWDDGSSTLVSQRDCTVAGGRSVLASLPDAMGAEAGVESERDDDTRRVGRGTSRRTRGASATGARRDDRLAADGPVTLPIVEEQIVPEAVWRDAGSAIVRVRTEDVPQTVEYEDAREEVVVEEVPVGRELAAGESLAPRTEGETTIIPVIREEVVVTTRRVLEKEVRVTKRVVTAPRSVEMTTRRQRVDVETPESSPARHAPETDADAAAERG